MFISNQMNRSWLAKAINIRHSEIEFNDAFFFQLGEHRFGVFTRNTVFKTFPNHFNFGRAFAISKRLFQIALKSCQLAWPKVINRQK